MSPSEKDFVRKELQKTGYQLEDKVASIFSASLVGCEVEPNYYFTDWQKEDQRELDLKVTYKVASRPITIEYVFLVECKKLPGHVWAFIESRQQPFLFKQAVSVWDNIGKRGRQEPVVEMLEPLFKLDDIVCDTYSHRFKEIILDPKKSNKRDDNIHTATIKLAKVIDFEKRRDEWINRNLRESVKREFDRILIYSALIVLEGKLYKAKMLPTVEPKRIPSAHLHHFSIQNKREIDMIIDVIDVRYLKNFLQQKLLVEAGLIKKKEAELRGSYLKLIGKLMQSKARYTG